jgi:flagellar biosynthetic protein FliR
MAPILISTAEIVRFGIVLVRLSGIMIFAPFFSNMSVPLQIRAVFTLVAAIVLSPALPLHSIPAELGLSSLTAVLANEFMVGAVLGFAASFIFAGFQFAGQIISFQLGFSLINVIDPQTQVEAPVFSFINDYIGLLFFLLINGHHWFLLAISESFKFLPVGGLHLQAPLLAYIIRLSSQILVIGIRIAGPIIAITIVHSRYAPETSGRSQLFELLVLFPPPIARRSLFFAVQNPFCARPENVLGEIHGGRK